MFVLCPTPTNGQGQTTGQPSLVWQKSYSSATNSLQFLITTKSNNYVFSYNNFQGSHGLNCFDNNGNMLWTRSCNVSLLLDMNQKNSFLATNTDDKLITVFNYAGDTIETVAPPTTAANFKWINYIAKDSNHYYMAYTDSTDTFYSLFIFDNNLQYIGSFPLESGAQEVVCGIEAEGNYIYVSRGGYGGGKQSNVSAYLFKYDFSGNVIWKQHFPDRTKARLAFSPDGNIYLGALNTSSPTKAWLSWEFAKLDTASGNFIWDKLWFDEYPDTLYISLFTYDFKTIPGGGCVMAGSATKLGLAVPFDINNVDPTMVAFSDSGEKIWELRDVNSHDYGAFYSIAWDNQNYLIGTAILGYNPWSLQLSKYSLPGITAVKEESSRIPEKFSLSQNYPNPFNPSTDISFSVPQSGEVTLKIYDLLGREVATLINKELNAGTYSTKFEAGNLASGVYIYRLSARNFSSTKKMVLLK